MKIEHYVLHLCDRAQTKCGVLDYVDQIPDGGDKIVFNNVKTARLP